MQQNNPKRISNGLKISGLIIIKAINETKVTHEKILGGSPKSSLQLQLHLH